MTTIKRGLLIFCFALLVHCGQVLAQGSDMVVLKKGPEKTLKTYLSGTQIHFLTIAGTEVKGQVRMIKKDSLFINIYDERAAYTVWGTSFWDTVAVGLSKYHIKEIREIFKPREKFSFIKNGLIFMMGGSSYAILHSVNALYLKQPIIPSTMLISGSVALTGFVLNKVHKRTVRLGNKYYLQYIPVIK
jgi:hypothetical protein